MKSVHRHPDPLLAEKSREASCIQFCATFSFREGLKKVQAVEGLFLEYFFGFLSPEIETVNIRPQDHCMRGKSGSYSFTVSAA